MRGTTLTRQVEPQRPPGPNWRLLIHPPADGAWNMAVDETLLERLACDPDEHSTTLRLYSWSPAALSLGKFQKAHGAFAPAFLREQGIHLVRRPTGGRAVLHEFERTYSVVGRLGRPPWDHGVRQTYRRVAEALLDALRELGLDPTAGSERPGAEPDGPSCFASLSAHEIGVGGLKLVGSAQLRRRGVFLQHGSILFRCDPARLAGAIGVAGAAAGFTDLETLLGRRPQPDEVDRALIAAFERHFGVGFRRADLNDRELRDATRLRATKYLSEAWTLAAKH